MLKPINIGFTKTAVWRENHYIGHDSAATQEDTQTRGLIMMDKELDLLTHYRQLHDGLSDMIEGGRLKEIDIPDDYRWLRIMLAEAAQMDDKIKQALDED